MKKDKKENKEAVKEEHIASSPQVNRQTLAKMGWISSGTSNRLLAGSVMRTRARWSASWITSRCSSLMFLPLASEAVSVVVKPVADLVDSPTEYKPVVSTSPVFGEGEKRRSTKKTDLTFVKPVFLSGN